MNEAEMIAFAERLFGRTGLTAETAYGSIPEWDSVNHLRLVMEAEAFFHVHYPLERIPFLRRLGDFSLEGNFSADGCHRQANSV